MNKQSNTNGSKRSILEEIDRELAEEARIPRYKLISPENSKRLYYVKIQLFIGGTLGTLALSAAVLLLFFWLPNVIIKSAIPLIFIIGGFATMTGGAITTFSKPDWNPSMTMSYKTKIRRDDIGGVLQMLLGLAEVSVAFYLLLRVLEG